MDERLNRAHTAADQALLDLQREPWSATNEAAYQAAVADEREAIAASRTAVTEPIPVQRTPHVALIIGDIDDESIDRVVGPFASEEHATGWAVMHPHYVTRVVPLQFPESPTAYSTSSPDPTQEIWGSREEVTAGFDSPRCEADYEGGGVCMTPLPTWQSPCPNADRHSTRN